MKPLGIDLGKLIAGEPFPADYEPDCPGASVRFTRKDFDDAARDGECFVTRRDTIPVDGYGSVRVHCRNVCERVHEPTSGHRMFYGLCHSCSKYEADNRATLRERARVRGDK